MTILEVVGFLFGIAGIWLTIRENVWCFPIGLVNVIISFFLFYGQQLYSDALQQIVYVVLLSYGWYSWNNGSDKNLLPIQKTDALLWMKLFFTGLIVAFTLGYYFGNYTDADLPYLDSSATALSFIAQFLIARKKIENWLLWMIVNILYIGIYISKDLYLYAFLFFIYLILAVYGYLKWRKELTNATL